VVPPNLVCQRRGVPIISPYQLHKKMDCRDTTKNQAGKCDICTQHAAPANLTQTLTPITTTKTFHTKDTGSWTEEDELAMPVSSVCAFFSFALRPFSPKTNLNSFAKMTPYTYSRIKGKDNGGGSGWSDEGKALYDDLFRQVQQNRTMYAKTFNQELLKIYQQRRNKGNGGNMTKQTNPIKKRRHRCLNELKDGYDVDEEQEYIHYHNSLSTKSSIASENDFGDPYIKSEAV
jgi:acyl-CoA-binding protein